MTDEQKEIISQFKLAVQAVNGLLEQIGREGIAVIVTQEERRDGEARILRLKPQLSHTEDLF